MGRYRRFVQQATDRLGGGPALVHVQPEDGGQHQGAPGPAQRAEKLIPEQPDPDGAEDGLQVAEHGRTDQPQTLEGLGVAKEGEIAGEAAQDQQPAPGGEAVVEADRREAEDDRRGSDRRRRWPLCILL